MTNGSTLLAFDFDGTLAPIRDDPTEVQLSRGAAQLLSQASRLRGVCVAIVTGRDLEDVASRVDLSCVYLVASHGLEILGPGGAVIRQAPLLQVALDETFEAEILASGVRLERKKHGIALHWRGVPYEAIAPLVDSFRDWSDANELETIEGRCVVEALLRGGGKEEAIRWLASAVGATNVVYAGDDTTDFGALQFAAERGKGVFVASSERTPPGNVTVVGSFRELFRLVREEVNI